MDDRPKRIRTDRPKGKADTAKVDLTAVVVALSDNEPCVLTIGQTDTLPSGPLALEHRSLQSGLRAWVEEQTGHPLGYIEQLYTFADRDRVGTEHEQRVISISYLALTRKEHAAAPSRGDWKSWYEYFPWEDHRAGTPPMVSDLFLPRLIEWADGANDKALRLERRRRAAIAFGFYDRPWNEDLALKRYELLY
ncbi:MAG: hypothetical protein E5W78_15805, partial [Mesorhizobium sp.]